MKTVTPSPPGSPPTPKSCSPSSIAIARLALLRAARLEAGMFTLALNTSLNDDNFTPLVGVDPDHAIDQMRNYTLADGFQRMAQSSNSWSLFLRYQAQVERQYRRAVEEFDRLRRLRDEIPNEPISDPQPEETETNPVPPTEPISPQSPSASRREAPPHPGAQPRREAAPPRRPAPSPGPPPPVLS